MSFLLILQAADDMKNKVNPKLSNKELEVNNILEGKKPLEPGSAMS